MDGNKHTYAAEEVAIFANMINQYLKDDEDVKVRLPIKTDGDDLFHVLEDGIVLCKLIMIIDSEAIDRRAINIGTNLNAEQIGENLKLYFSVAKGSLGLKLLDVGLSDFVKKVPQLNLGDIWSVLR